MAQPTETATSERDLRREIEQLRARLAALEAELVDVQAHADQTVGEWQERAYWLDRWHLDLNALMRKPGAAQARAGLRAVRSVVRVFIRVKRRLTNP